MDSEEPSTLDQAKALTSELLGRPGRRTKYAQAALAIAAVGGFCIVLLTTLGGMMPFDDSLRYALYGFAVGIPCLAAEFYASTIPAKNPTTFGEQVEAASQFLAFRLVADVVGFGGAFLGIVAYFAHLDPTAAKLFVFAVPALLALWGVFFGLIALAYGIQAWWSKRKAAGKA